MIETLELCLKSGPTTLQMILYLDLFTHMVHYMLGVPYLELVIRVLEIVEEAKILLIYGRSSPKSCFL